MTPDEVRALEGAPPLNVWQGKREAMFTSSITGCARCDGDGHADITWQPLTFPIEDSDGSLWTHWALCPRNGEPILMRVRET